MTTHKLADLALIYPSLRRYVQQGFELASPALGMETEYEIISRNQRLTVNPENSSVRETPEWVS